MTNKKEEVKEAVKELAVLKLEMSMKDANALANILNIAVKVNGIQDRATFNNVNYFLQMLDKAAPKDEQGTGRTV